MKQNVIHVDDRNDIEAIMADLRHFLVLLNYRFCSQYENKYVFQNQL